MDIESGEYLQLKCRIEEAQRNVTDLNEARTRISDKLRKEESDENSEIYRKWRDESHEKQLIWQISSKKELLKMTIEELDSLYNTNETIDPVCSSDGETQIHIKKLRNRIKHGSSSLADERKMFREMKDEQETQKITANVVSNPTYRRYRTTSDSKRNLTNRIKLISSELEELEMAKEKFDVDLKRNKVAFLYSHAKKTEILQKELERIDRLRDIIITSILQLKEKRGDQLKILPPGKIPKPPITIPTQGYVILCDGVFDARNSQAAFALLLFIDGHFRTGEASKCSVSSAIEAEVFAVQASVNYAKRFYPKPVWIGSDCKEAIDVILNKNLRPIDTSACCKVNFIPRTLNGAAYFVAKSVLRGDLDPSWVLAPSVSLCNRFPLGFKWLNDGFRLSFIYREHVRI